MADAFKANFKKLIGREIDHVSPDTLTDREDAQSLPTSYRLVASGVIYDEPAPPSTVIYNASIGRSYVLLVAMNRSSEKTPVFTSGDLSNIVLYGVENGQAATWGDSSMAAVLGLDDRHFTYLAPASGITISAAVRAVVGGERIDLDLDVLSGQITVELTASSGAGYNGMYKLWET